MLLRTTRPATPIWNRDYLASEPTLTTDPKQVVTYKINPKAVWYDGTPITWEDFYWQWKAKQRHEQGVPDLVGERLRRHRERGRRARTTAK